MPGRDRHQPRAAAGARAICSSLSAASLAPKSTASAEEAPLALAAAHGIVRDQHVGVLSGDTPGSTSRRAAPGSVAPAPRSASVPAPAGSCAAGPRRRRGHGDGVATQNGPGAGGAPISDLQRHARPVKSRVRRYAIRGLSAELAGDVLLGELLARALEDRLVGPASTR